MAKHLLFVIIIILDFNYCKYVAWLWNL